MKKGYVEIVAAMLVLIGLAGVFLYLRFLRPVETAPTATPIDMSDICAVQSDQILATVDKFETYQKNHEADNALLMFTPASGEEEKQEYDYLSGGGLVIARLYNSINSDYEVNSYKVTSDPHKSVNGGCLVFVEEMRKLYASLNNEEFKNPEPVEVKFLLVQDDDKWMIESYKSRDVRLKDGKYSGFTLEYEEQKEL